MNDEHTSIHDALLILQQAIVAEYGSWRSCPEITLHAQIIDASGFSEPNKFVLGNLSLDVRSTTRHK